MKVALAFWGLTRSLKYTIQSIQAHILDVLTEHTIDYTIFLHTYSFSGSYMNPRAREHNIQLDFNEYSLLHPKYIQIDDQDEVKRKIDVRKYRTHPDPWETKYATVDNFLCAMYSRLQLGLMLQRSAKEFDYVIFLRPDVRYLVPFNVEVLKYVDQTTVCIPDFHHYPKFNDRFLIATYQNAIRCCELFNYMYNYSKLHPLHSETFQHAIVTTQYGLIPKSIPFYFNRVRANGTELADCPGKEIVSTSTAASGPEVPSLATRGVAGAASAMNLRESAQPSRGLTRVSAPRRVQRIRSAESAERRIAMPRRHDAR